MPVMREEGCKRATSEGETGLGGREQTRIVPHPFLYHVASTLSTALPFHLPAPSPLDSAATESWALFPQRVSGRASAMAIIPPSAAAWAWGAIADQPSVVTHLPVR